MSIKSEVSKYSINGTKIPTKKYPYPYDCCLLLDVNMGKSTEQDVLKEALKEENSILNYYN